METILKTGYKKIMRLFYEKKNVQIHLRDIARRTGLNSNSVTRFLSQLEKRNILKSVKEGNLKKYSVRKNMGTFLVFSIFDVERADKLLSLRKEAINYFLKKLKEQPIIVLLFGSTAKLSSVKGSDIDLLFVVNKKIKVKGAEDYAEAQTGINVNCLQISYSDFIKEVKIKEDCVVQSAINSGYPLTNRLKYYEMVMQ
ncbi:nucleotidyltransferase domain-containing protein [Candidatus Pacearchaeota archaeon]|nr:nucleotidyltransferase domain-containing protein [Candidatus Pacearchaeota archaeon]